MDCAVDRRRSPRLRSLPVRRFSKIVDTDPSFPYLTLSRGPVLLPRPAQSHGGLVEGHAAPAAEEFRVTPLWQVARLDIIVPAGRMDEDVANGSTATPDPPHERATNVHIHTPGNPNDQ